MTHGFVRLLNGLGRVSALVASFGVTTASFAYDPEIGAAIATFPIVHAGGQSLDWSPDTARFRILIVGATWCPPCQELRASLPNELARLRQAGVSVSTIFVESDEFGAAIAGRAPQAAGVNRWGFIEAVPDPSRINLSKESLKGVRDWGAFRAYGYPTTVLLDDRNVVVERYRGGRASQGVFNDVIALAQRTGNVSTTPIEMPAATVITSRKAALPAALPDGVNATIPRAAKAALPTAGVVARDRTADQAGDELIGLWKINNPEAKEPRPLFLRVIGVQATSADTLQLEASLSFKLTKWSPINVRCEIASPSCVLRLTTSSGGELTAKRQADGHYVGTIVHMGRSRPVVRHITMEPLSLDDADL